MRKDTESLLLIGSGPMAIEYAKVLRSLGQKYIVIGRRKKNAEIFEKTLQVKVITCGIDNFLSNKKRIIKTAIVAVSEEQLGIVSRKLIGYGVKLILVEKPAGLDFRDIKKVEDLAKRLQTRVYVGYNRRFYSSVVKAKEIIKKDGGILSIYFDFTEASFRVAPLIKAPGVKENWFLQNSTHVIDLIIFLAGLPKKISSYTSDSLSWHSEAAIFSGGGITTKGILFSYHANWKAPGRWVVEIMTKRNKLIFKPMEKLQVQEFGTFEIKDVPLEDRVDTKFKAGIYKEVQSFLGNKQDLCTIEEQVKNLEFYQQILEGNS